MKSINRDEERLAAEAAFHKVRLAREYLAYHKYPAPDQKAPQQSLSRDTKAFVALVLDKLLGLDSDAPSSSNTQAQFNTAMCEYYDAVLPDGPKLHRDKNRLRSIFWIP